MTIHSRPGRIHLDAARTPEDQAALARAWKQITCTHTEHGTLTELRQDGTAMRQCAGCLKPVTDEADGTTMPETEAGA